MCVPQSRTVHVAVRSLYFASSLGALPGTARAMTVPRFCRELLLHVVRYCPLCLRNAVHGALLTVLLDELDRLPYAGMWLPSPTTPAPSISWQPPEPIQVRVPPNSQPVWPPAVEQSNASSSLRPTMQAIEFTNSSAASGPLSESKPKCHARA
jgi:hypothetical protein